MKFINVSLIGVMLLLLIAQKQYSQWQSKLPGNQNVSENNSRGYSLKEISNAFNEYWAPFEVSNGYYIENGVRKKASGYNQFKREEWYWEQRVNPQTGEFPSTTSAIEFEKSQFRLNKLVGRTSTANWTNIGTNSSTGGYAGIGRINCIAFHPTDTTTYWVGAPSGGIWKTTDNGSNWACINSSLSALGVSDIAIPSNYATSNTIYIVTGDRDGGSLSSLGSGKIADNISLGVYKSTNGGSTWTATGLTKLNTDNKIIGRLLLASNNTTLYASVYLDGIYKSTDSGSNWTRIASLPYSYVIDMEFKPGNENTIYASTKSVYSDVSTFIYKTTDAGSTWIGSTALYSSINQVFTGQVGAGRIELAVTAADPTVVYAIYSYPSKLYGIYKSTDSGETFNLIWNGQVANHNLLGYNVDANDLTAGQGRYDLCIAVSPANANIVFIGGVNTWMTTDGGSSWKIKTHWSTSGTSPNRYRAVHADKHALNFQSERVLFEGNDGGVYRAQLTNNDWLDAGSDFVDKSNGLVISQVYRIGVSKSDVTKVLTGLQDNGSKLYNSSTWSDVSGGDGLECLIDYSNPLYMYSSYVYGVIYRATDGYANPNIRTTISANITGGQPTGAWVTPYIMNPLNSQILYAGYDKVWKTKNRGDSWTAISSALSSTNKLRSLAIAPSDTSVIYAADLSAMWKTTDAAAATPTWSSISLPTTAVSLTYIAVKANDPSTIWITYGGYSSGLKVYESTNGGSSWTNISGTLPNVPVLCITQNTRSTGSTQLFIGTDVGVYAKDGSADWIYYNDGLPSVVVTELEFYYGATQAEDKLRAATYGRGLWETSVEAALPVQLTKFTAMAKEKNQIILDWITATEINNYGFEIQRSTGKEDWINIGFVKGHGNSNSPKFYSFVDMPNGGLKFLYRLKQIDFNGKFEYSPIEEATIGNPSSFTVHQNFPNPFNPTTNIRYELPYAGNVTIKLYDAIGREVKVLSSKHETAGFHQFLFDGSQVASGVYYYSIKMGEFLQTRKMILVK